MRALWRQHALAALIALLSVASIWVFFTTDPVLTTLLDFLGARLLIILVYGAIGYLITVRRPDVLVGWLVLGGAGLLAASALSIEFGLRSRQPGAAVPGGVLAVWPGFWIGPAGIALLGLALAVFPDGPLRTRRGRIALWAQVAIAMVYVANLALVPHRSLVHGLPNPIAIGALAQLPFYRLNILFGLMGLVLGLGALVARYRGATLTVQQQIRWVIPAGTLVAAGDAITLLSLQIYVISHGSIDFRGDLATIQAPVSFLLVTVLLPLAIGIGILRYRLFDIDVVVNRALVYGGATAILAGAFAGLSTAAQYILRAMTGQQSEIVSIALAVLATVAFTPLKARVQAVVDRRLKGPRVPAARMAEG
jgi:hypothetical protein